MPNRKDAKESEAEAEFYHKDTKVGTDRYKRRHPCVWPFRSFLFVPLCLGGQFLCRSWGLDAAGVWPDKSHLDFADAALDLDAH